MNWPGHRFALTLFLSVVALWLGAMLVVMRHAALPPEATGTMLVVFNSTTAKDQAFASIIDAGARPIRETAFGFIWVVTGDQSGLAGKLEANGAIGSYRELPINPTLAGCTAIIDAKTADTFGF